jgi:hypothetical protein
MGRVTKIINARSEGSGRLHLELLYESDLPDGPSVVKNLHIDRDKFLGREHFQLAMENAGIRPTVEGGSRLGAKQSNLRKDWEFWKARVEAGEV